MRPERDGPWPRDIPDWYLARGRHFVPTAEIAEILGLPMRQIGPVAARWRVKNRVFSPTHGAYVMIPPECHEWDAVPPSHFIDQMMRFRYYPYYVAFLTAAELHGAPGRVDHAFQVVTNVRLGDREFGFRPVRLEFVYAGAVADRATVTRKTPAGTMRVSSREVTVHDLVGSPERGAGLPNVTIVVAELLEAGKIDPAKLTRAARGYSRPIRQRTGWLIEHAAHENGRAIDLSELAGTVAGALPTKLAVSGDPDGPVDDRWQLIVNTDVTHGL